MFSLSNELGTAHVNVKGEGSRDVNIKDMTYGVSSQGMEIYVKNLRTELITKCFDKLEDTKAVSDAIVKGWQGASRDKFLQSFENAIESVERDLRSEWVDLQYRLAELEVNYFKQDAQLAKQIEEQI